MLSPAPASVEHTRQLVRLLVQTRAQGTKSQSALAVAIQWSSRDLSNFMTGNGSNKGQKLDRLTLDNRAASLLAALERNGFMPQQPLPGTSAPEEAPPPPPAPEPLPKPPPPLPSTPISTVKLTDIVGAHAGGAVDILSLGERVGDGLPAD